MGRKIGMQIKKSEDGTLESFSVPYGSRITYSQLNKGEVKTGEFPTLKFGESANRKLDRIVELMYEKLLEQPITTWAILRLCGACDIPDAIRSEAEARLRELGIKKGDPVEQVYVGKDRPFEDIYFVRKSRLSHYGMTQG
jgi:hypothetical protein